MVRDFQCGDRRRGARADAGGRRPAARHAGRLHRRRLQRHRPVPSLPRRARRADDRRRGRAATASTTGKHAASLTGGAPGVLHGNRTYLLQDDDGQIIDAHSISAGLDYPGIGPEHAWLHDSGRVEYVSVTDDEALAGLPAAAPGSKASSRRSESAHAARPCRRRCAPRLPQGPSAGDQSVRPRRQGHRHRRRARWGRKR